jgi:hypothetical protein
VPVLQTSPSTRRLSEVARHVVVPSGIVATGWPAVEAKCTEFGDTFDEWQRGAGRVILGKRADGIYAATIGGITLSIPRQVAKTFIVGRVVFALCCLFPGLKVVWTAHRSRTATQTFQKLQGLAKRRSVAPYVSHIRIANGEQEIGFANDSVIMFGARETGFGRGFDEVDVEVFDEAQILTEKALDDMVAATNQSRHPHGALLFFMGTPPKPADPGEAFTTRRKEALSGESEDAVYIECSADPDADPDDREQWTIANPSFPHRTPLRSMLRLRKNLLSDESWMREALGIWDDESEGRWLVVPHRLWSSRLTIAVRPEAVAFAVAASHPDADRFSIAVAGRVDDRIAVQVVETRAGRAWVPDRLVQLREQWKPTAVVCRDRGPTAALHAELKAARCDLVTPWVKESAAAFRVFHDGVLAGDPVPVVHFGQPELDHAVKVARRRASGDGWVWDQPEPELEAVTLATWGHIIRPKTGDPGMWII